MHADGSAMHPLQSRWTQAREQLPVTTAMRMLDLGNPSLNWVQMANSMGVEAARAATLEQCADLMHASYKSDKPFVIDLVV